MSLVLPTGLLGIGNFFKSIPWQIYAALALLAAFPLTYCHGKNAGRAEVKAELREAQAEAAQKSLEAIAEADGKAAERAEAEADVIEKQLKAIEDAEAQNENALDALFQ